MNNVFISSSQLIMKGRGFITDIIASATTFDGVLKLYDGCSTVGKLICTINVGNGFTITHQFKTFILFETGLYAELSGTNPTASIGYHVDTVR